MFYQIHRHVNKENISVSNYIAVREVRLFIAYLATVARHSTRNLETIYADGGEKVKSQKYRNSRKVMISNIDWLLLTYRWKMEWPKLWISPFVNVTIDADWQEGIKKFRANTVVTEVNFSNKMTCPTLPFSQVLSNCGLNWNHILAL